MGSYCSLKIAGYEIDSAKSYIDPFWSLVLRESDRQIRRTHFSEYYTEAIEEGTDLVNSYVYVVRVKNVKDRLSLLGYTLDGAMEAFNHGMNAIVKEMEEYGFDYPPGSDYCRRLAKDGFEEWRSTVRQIIQKRVYSYNLDRERDRAKDDLATYFLDEEVYLKLGYPGDGGYFLRAVVEAVEEDDEMLLDVTSLIYAGYYSEDFPICEGTLHGQVVGAVPFQKIIVLTEGRSDTAILSRSLALLYPHLANYFSFMDFDASRADGGASQLERTVKSFAGAGITNKTIALFDNDAAGSASISLLAKYKLPDNIKVLLLPTIDLSGHYPTVGPQGVVSTDIGGLACSIELYLGRDVLSGADGKLTPVRWTGLDVRVNKYQGELQGKTQIQAKFFEKIAVAEKGRLEGDWNGLKAIFEMIFATVSTM